MKLFHGSHSKTAPVIKVGEFALLPVDNLFDGLFASADFGVADSHAQDGWVHAYNVETIAENRDLDERFLEVRAFLAKEFEAPTDVIEAFADAIIYETAGDEFDDMLTPRSCDQSGAGRSWELQRIRGRVAAHLGFDAIEMLDEHGTSYLIINPSIRAIIANADDEYFNSVQKEAQRGFNK